MRCNSGYMKNPSIPGGGYFICSQGDWVVFSGGKKIVFTSVPDCVGKPRF